MAPSLVRTDIALYPRFECFETVDAQLGGDTADTTRDEAGRGGEF